MNELIFLVYNLIIYFQGPSCRHLDPRVRPPRPPDHGFVVIWAELPDVVRPEVFPARAKRHGHAQAVRQARTQRGSRHDRRSVAQNASGAQSH